MFPTDDQIQLILSLRFTMTQTSIAKKLGINSGYVSRIFSMEDEDLLDDFILARKQKRALQIMQTKDMYNKEFAAERARIRQLLGLPR